MFVEQVRRCDDKAWLADMLGKQRGHVGFTQPDHIRQKRSAVFIKHFACIQDGLFLIFQFLKSSGQMQILDFIGQVEFTTEIFVKKF